MDRKLILFLCCVGAQAQILGPIFFQNAGAANAGFSHVRSITFDHTKVGTVDQTAYPVLVTSNADILNGAINNSVTAITVTNGKQILTNDYIMIDSEIMLVTAGGGTTSLTVTRAQKSTAAASHLDKQVINNQAFASSANGGSGTSSSGYDIVFSSDALYAMPLTWEIGNYNANGLASFIIKIPTFSHTVDTVIYVSYGNSAITTLQSTAANVWTNGYISRYGFGAGLGGTISTVDSVGNNNCTNHGAVIANGLIPTATGSTIQATSPGGYYNPQSGANYFDCGTASSANLTTMTVEGWEEPTDANNAYVIMGKEDDTNHTGWALYTGAGNLSAQYQDGSVKAIMRVSSGCCGNGFPGTYVAWTITGTTNLLYANAVSKAFTNVGAAATGIAASTVNLGTALNGGSNAFNFWGQLNEVRISNVVRSVDYFTANYNFYGSPYANDTVASIR